MLAVAPEAMGRGVGLALAQECIDRARADGRGRILLNTGDAQVAARRLYERLGFERRPDLDELIDEDLWMRTYSLELR
jgi:ribosomal protein S18 acetylase RimI-like enzyme